MKSLGLVYCRSTDKRRSLGYNNIMEAAMTIVAPIQRKLTKPRFAASSGMPVTVKPE